MKKLAYAIKQIEKRNRDGSHATQANRSRILAMCVEQLGQAGYKTNQMTPHDLKGRHVNALIKRWRDDNVSVATIKNRLSALRWLAEKIGNKGFVKSNTELGIENRTYITNTDKSVSLASVVDWSALSDDVCLSVLLQKEFGLRREEAMKFQIDYATSQGADKIIIKPSWAKGGRYREIPITNERQTALLAKIHEHCHAKAQSSMIPNDKTYRQHMKTFESQTSSAGIGRTHGLRHQYAQSRYKQLMGFDCPAVGGVRELTSEEISKDRAVRLQISNELGHNRLQVTGIYLGSWSMKR